MSYDAILASAVAENRELKQRAVELEQKLYLVTNDRDNMRDNVDRLETENDHFPDAGNMIKAAEQRVAVLEGALTSECEACALIADKYVADVEKQLAGAKRRQHNAGLLLAVGYQGDPDGDVSHLSAIADAAKDIARDIRGRAVLRPAETGDDA